MNKRGASTVFLMIVVTGLIIFGLLLIDMTRIFVAENRVLRAAKTAENSLLASYDRKTALDFGLFGEGSTKKKQEAIFYDYFRRNLDSSQSRLGISYQLKAEDCTVEALTSLMDDQALKSQMIGNVKYKSPEKWAARMAEAFGKNGEDDLKAKNQQARNDRERKRQMKLRKAELREELRSVKGKAAESISNQIERITEELEKMDESQMGQSPSEARIPGPEDIENFLKNKLTEATGIKNVAVPPNYFPQGYGTGASENVYKLEGKSNTEEEREKMDSSALNTMTSFFTSVRGLAPVQKGASDVLDRLFLTEYILDRFSSVLSEKEGHFYKKGEIEYLISGELGDTELGAISKTVLKIWTIRFSINFIVALVRNPIPEPMERLAYALLTGGIEASTEVLRLLAGYSINAIPDSPRNIQISYEDHLRILLALKSEKALLYGTRLMVNCTSMSNGGPNVGKMGTFFHVKYKASIRLLFIPLFKPELFSDRFINGSYVIGRDEYFGY